VSVTFDGVQNDGTGNENDLLTGGIENIIGSGGDDLLVANDAANQISGLDGDDIIHDRGGADGVSGGAGADHVVAGLGQDLYGGGTGGSVADPAVDTIDYSARTARVEIQADANLFALEADDGEAGENDTAFPDFERIVGTAHNDLLEGANSSKSGGGPQNFIEGGGGNDSLLGNDGVDVLDGGTGNDSMDGGAGSDTADYAKRIAAVTVDLDGVAGDGEAGENDNALVESVRGGDGDDRITGNDQDNARVRKG
jgi:Ca2+-binding RTX toxin-like protein